MTSRIKKGGFSTKDFGTTINKTPCKVMNEKVLRVCMEEGGQWVKPVDKIKVSDIIANKICKNNQGQSCWYVNVFKHIRNPFFCHAFETESGKRYDAVNNAGIYI